MNQYELNKFLNSIDTNLGVGLSSQVAAIYTYGSNNKVLHNPLISDELDLVFVLKNKSLKSKRNSDINRDDFNFFITEVTTKLKDTRVIFNGEYPKVWKDYDFYIDIIIDNITSISEGNPTSKITSRLEKELIWGEEVYLNLENSAITNSDLTYLAKQKIEYLNRIYSKRDDKFAIKTYSKGLLFTYWLYLSFSTQQYDYKQEIDELKNIMEKNPSRIYSYVNECFDRLIYNA
jgi:hypothetical protein